MEEDRYERIELIVKAREDESWFDTIFDYISGDCEGGGGECLDKYSDCDEHEHSPELPCTCGLESMGGTAGTLQQCYDAGSTVGHIRGQRIMFIDVARAIVDMLNTGGWKPETYNVIQWARDEIHFEEHWNDPFEETEE